MEVVGAEGIVSKRLGSRYPGGESRDWRKTKCHATGQFIVTGFQELGPNRLEALHVAELRDGDLVVAGQVRFGFAGKGLWPILDQLRVGPAGRYGIVTIEPCLMVKVEYFGRHKGGAIRDGVLIALVDQPVPPPAPAT
jgi:bifunctional non-homologous end joining protein LigD